MLNLDTEYIRDLMDKARQFQAKEEVCFPEVTDDMDALYVLADHKDDAVYQEAVALIDDLRPEQQATLMALMYFGRDDSSGNTWQETYQLALQELTNHTGNYLLSTPLAADYIEEGLDRLGIVYRD